MMQSEFYSPNPDQPPSNGSNSSSSRLWDVAVVGLWLTIPFGVFLARQRLLPVFNDFDAKLPIATQSLLHVYSPFLFAMASVVVVLGMFVIHGKKMRRRFMWGACIVGVLVAAACSMLILSPVFALWQDLN